MLNSLSLFSLIYAEQPTSTPSPLRRLRCSRSTTPPASLAATTPLATIFRSEEMLMPIRSEYSGVASSVHYYRNANLSRLGNPCCPGFPTGNAKPGQKRGPFVPGLATGTFFFLFFFSQFFFYFNYTFAFQLNLCIGIQCV